MKTVFVLSCVYNLTLFVLKLVLRLKSEMFQTNGINVPNMPERDICFPQTENNVNMNSNTSSGDGSWQTIPSSSNSVKKRVNELSNHDSTFKKTRQEHNYFKDPIVTQNRYEALSESDEMNCDQPQTNASLNVPKPPPIFIPDITNVNKMMSAIETAITKEEYSYKCLDKNKIKLNPCSEDAYRKIVHKLTELKVSFHTFQLKHERAFRVVLKNMHFSTDINDLKSSIEAKGHKVRNIVNARHFKTKEPLSMFFVDLEPSTNNKEIYNIEFLLNAKIVFEAPRKKREIVQCKKCQSYGHTRAYCWHSHRCVKCGQSHDTSTCTKPQTEKPKCALCSGEHPANYKGCTVYKELRNKSFPPLREKSMPSPKIIQRPPDVESKQAESTSDEYNIPQPPRNSKTYAQIAANSRNEQHLNNSNSLEKTISSFFSKFEQLMLQQAQQIGSLLNLLTTVVSKLK